MFTYVLVTSYLHDAHPLLVSEGRDASERSCRERM